MYSGFLTPVCRVPGGRFVDDYFGVPPANWTYETGDGVSDGVGSSPAIAGGVVFVGSSFGDSGSRAGQRLARSRW